MMSRLDFNEHESFIGWFVPHVVTEQIAKDSLGRDDNHDTNPAESLTINELYKYQNTWLISYLVIVGLFLAFRH